MRHPFHSSVPVILTHGKTEILYDDIMQFAKGMQQITGNRVHLLELGNTPHDIMMSGVATGFTKEAVEGGHKALEYLKMLNSQSP